MATEINNLESEQNDLDKKTATDTEFVFKLDDDSDSPKVSKNDTKSLKDDIFESHLQQKKESPKIMPESPEVLTEKDLDKYSAKIDPKVESTEKMTGIQSPVQTKSRKISLGVLWFVLTTIIFITMIIFGSFWFYNNYQNQLPISKLTVSATEKATTKPDTAINTFYISQSGSVSSEVNSKVDSTKEKLLNYLKEQGLTEKDIVVSKSTYPYYYNPLAASDSAVSVKSQKLVPTPTQAEISAATSTSPDGTSSNSGSGVSVDIGFVPPTNTDKQSTIEVSVQATFRNIQSKNIDFDGITAKSLELGVTRFSGYSYSLVDTQSICEDLKSKALSKALKDGENQINLLGGKKIIRKEISNLNYYYNSCQDTAYPIYRDATVSSDSTGANPQKLTFETFASQQTLQFTIEITFEYR